MIEAATRVAGFSVIVRPQGHPRCLTDEAGGSRMWNRACSATKWKNSGMRSGYSVAEHMNMIAVQGFTISKEGITLHAGENVTCSQHGQVYSKDREAKCEGVHDCDFSKRGEERESVIRLLEHISKVVTVKT